MSSSSTKEVTSLLAPRDSGMAVHAVVERHLKGDKVLVFKKKRRKGYQKLNGFRASLTEIKCGHQKGDGKKTAPKGAEPKAEAAPKETAAKKPAAKKPAAKKPAAKSQQPKTSSQKPAAKSSGQAGGQKTEE